MAGIVNLRQLGRFLPKEGRSRIVLTGGCFDILHIGHVRFLSEAKKMGDYLVVLLEGDRKVKELKGRNRPLFVQKERAEMLSALGSVDLVVLLPPLENNRSYLDLVKKIRPSVIAVTESDPRLEEKKEQARKIGGKLKVVPLTKRFSTSNLAKVLGVD